MEKILPVKWDRKRQISIREFSAADAFCKTVEEAKEALDAENAGDREHAGEELVDVATSAFTSLYRLGFTEDDVDRIIRKVNEKNKSRGAFRT